MDSCQRGKRVEELNGEEIKLKKRKEKKRKEKKRKGKIHRYTDNSMVVTRGKGCGRGRRVIRGLNEDGRNLDLGW